MQGSKIKIMKQ